ncbi:MAG TPA: hypothetical protein VMY18_10425 [Acidobacteriota bacterium]|nr:hypothetical protein [Acidobacteriota bacterium]
MPPADRMQEHAERAAAGKVMPGEKPIMNVIEVLETHRKGRTLGDMQEGLQELVAAVRETKRKGKLTVTLSVECRTPGVAKTLEVDMKVKVMAPEPIREKTMFFSTQKNTLQREDPAQGTLDGIIED